MKKHLIFAALVAGFSALIILSGHRFVLFTSRFHGHGIDLFTLSAWCACYWRGQFLNSVHNPYPYRSAAILLGVVGMLAAMLFKFVLEIS